jgi:hypothetical protein
MSKVSKICKGRINKRCPDGELYKFKKGVAIVPGVRSNGKVVTITFPEFISLVREIRKEEEGVASNINKDDWRIGGVI